MKEVPGSTLIMLVMHAYPVPFFSEAGDKETRGVDLPIHQSNLGKAPSRPPLQVHTPPLAKMQIETRLQEIRPGRYNQDTSMVGRYGAEVYIRGTVVPLHHSATTLGGVHTSRHIEKKHYQRDQRKNRLL
jgi:hypothetical protein